MSAACDHKFVDSTKCVKCGWTPQRLQIEVVRHFVRPDERSATSFVLRTAVCGQRLQSRRSHYHRDEVTCPRCLAWLRAHDELQP